MSLFLKNKLKYGGKKKNPISGIITFYFDFLVTFLLKVSFHKLNHPNLSKIQNKIILD